MEFNKIISKKHYEYVLEIKRNYIYIYIYIILNYLIYKKTNNNKKQPKHVGL